jgi:hypothetical protein
MTIVHEPGTKLSRDCYFEAERQPGFGPARYVITEYVAFTKSPTNMRISAGDTAPKTELSFEEAVKALKSLDQQQLAAHYKGGFTSLTMDNHYVGLFDAQTGARTDFVKRGDYNPDFPYA